MVATVQDRFLGLLTAIYILLVLLVTPSSSFISSVGRCTLGRSLFASTIPILPNADLTPAVDKYVRLPPTEAFTGTYFMTAKGPVPSGPDPFQLVSSELQPLSDYVKELMVSENPVLTMAATHFFDQVITFMDRRLQI